MPSYRKLEKEGQWVPVVLPTGHSYIYESHEELVGLLDSLEKIAGIKVETRRVFEPKRGLWEPWHREYSVSYPVYVNGVKHYVESEGFQTVRAAVSWALSELIEGEFKQ